MGFWSEVKQAWRDTAPDRMGPGETRRLDQNDLASWEEATLRRDANESRRPRTVEQVHRLLKFRNPVRYRQLIKDIEWAKKQLVKMGLNPEDLRYFL